MKTTIKWMTRRIAASIAIILALAAAQTALAATDIYWQGGNGSETNPVNIYSKSSWTGSNTYSGSGISKLPCNEHNLQFGFAADAEDTTAWLKCDGTTDSTAIANLFATHSGHFIFTSGSFRTISNFSVGRLSGDNSTVTKKDGDWTIGGDLNIGYVADSTGIVEVVGGSISVSKTQYIGYSGNGTLTINGGTVEVASGYNTTPGWNSGSSGTINLNRGFLKTKRIAHNNGSGRLNFNGGTLQANTDSNTDFIKSGIAVNVVSGGTIDNGGFAIKIPAAFNGSGSLTFKGSGTTTLSGSVSSYNGVTRVVAGSTPCVSKDIATKMLSNGLVLVGAPEVGTSYTILTSSSETDDWSSLSLSKVTCPAASAFTPSIGADGKSIVVTVTSLKSGNVWTGAKDSNMSDPDNWMGGVVPAEGADVDLSGATVVNGDLGYALGTVTMGSSVVTFTGSFTAASFSDTSKVAVGANSTVTLDGNLEFSSGNVNSFVCDYVGDGGTFVVTGDVITSKGFTGRLDPCKESVGTGVVAAKGLVNNGGKDMYFRLVRGIAGYHANWLIGANGLSGSKKFGIDNVNATVKITASADFTVSGVINNLKTLELDPGGHKITIASKCTGSGTTTVSGTGTVALNTGASLGTGAINLGAGTTLALYAPSRDFSLVNTLNLPTTGTATIRIDGTRLRSGDNVIATLGNAATTDNVTLDPASEAIDIRKDTLHVDDGNLVLTIVPRGFVISIF